MWTNRRMDKRTKNGQTNERNFTNFEKNLAMMIYLPVKFEFNWTTVFELESRNENVDRRMDRKTDKKWTEKRTKERTELHQFRKEPSYDGDICPCPV